ncbi:glycosyltransferase 87 family protein [Actinoplanes sp. N902-109]|uniref:glycosyltransferase 87 family protein n=1 Tax=Actinoplanes sp. (strain N902-109) TaxID=649831 RepID=UPI0003293A91|nr:glycosyltransferase 87 family protein [Actinoplanes sp. N902-109]AGL14924.1 hypothetical protein L083_1414 [Actinoplanes sp. N902-109]
MGTSRRQFLWFLTAVVALLTAYAVLDRPPDVRLSDLGVYVGATDGLRHGSSLYDFVRGNAPFTYPPFAGLVFLPLAGAPTLPLQIVWTLASLTTIVLLAGLLARHTALPAPLLALLLTLSAPVSSDLKYGQVSLFLAAMVAVDLLALRHHRAQGVLIGVAAAIKLTPLIFIPLLWLSGRRRAAVVATATFAAAGVLAAIALPGDSWRFWTAEVTHVSRLGYVTNIGNQSLNGALLRFDFPTPIRAATVLLIGGGLAAFALWHSSRLARAHDWFSALVITGTASVILSPVSWTHHQLWLVLAAFLPVTTVRHHGRLPGRDHSGGAVDHGPTLASRTYWRIAWPATVLMIMLLPITALGTPLASNSRLLLAIAVVCLAASLSPSPPPHPAIRLSRLALLPAWHPRLRTERPRATTAQPGRETSSVAGRSIP